MASKVHMSFLIEDLSLMLSDSDDHNVIIQVGENKNMKEFCAHSNILKARSPYFNDVKWITKTDKKDNMFEFKLPNINPTVFEMILKYIYTSKVDLTKQTGENILGLLVASDELLLRKLFEYVQDHLIKNNQHGRLHAKFFNGVVGPL
ncbi:BTB/POZ protein [Glomus cerebriforme]|uniref:BTB/POZ protein n=1 Tax=Glomus cerebriforme TaxID=658196 RepID=A0A397T9M3_9GLOM|nr:BTB/POZ protein [Glomus cerebriforme]